MMMVYPVPGRIIHDPVTQRPVRPRGLKVSKEDPFWIRALRAGDVSETPSKAEDAPENAEADSSAATEEGGE